MTQFCKKLKLIGKQKYDGLEYFLELLLVVCEQFSNVQIVYSHVPYFHGYYIP